MADTNYSSDSFDSDSNSSVVSPYSTSSGRNPSANPAASTTFRPSDRSPIVNLRDKKMSVDSQGDPPYSTVEDLGGGFSSFGPLPPVEFRSTPIEEMDTDSDDWQENRSDTATSPDNRKSFTNELFRAVHDPRDVDLGEGGTSYERFQEKDISGMENRGYDTDEELNEHLANLTESGTSDDKKSMPTTDPKIPEELYAKVDKTKKKKNHKQDNSESNPSTTNSPSKEKDLHSNPDKNKKTFRKTSLEPQGHQASGHAEEPGYDAVVVYDERTNL